MKAPFYLMFLCMPLLLQLGCNSDVGGPSSSPNSGGASATGYSFVSSCNWKFVGTNSGLSRTAMS